MHSWETFTRDDVCRTNPKFGERSHESMSCSDHSPLDHSLLPGSRLTTATGGRCLRRLSGDSASVPHLEPQRHLPKAHHARCAPTLNDAGPALNRPSDVGIGSPRPVLKLTGRTHDHAEIRSGSLELFRPRRARRPLSRSPSGRRALSPGIQLKQIAVSDRGSLRGLTHFPRSASLVRVEPAESKRDARKAHVRHSTEIPKPAEGRSFQGVRRAARVGRASHRGKSARSEASRPFERLEDSRG